MNNKKGSIDPLQIFMQGDRFFKAFNLLSSDKVLGNDVELMTSVAEPVMVLSAFNSELFLKCLVCIESGRAPRGHDLRSLFDQLTQQTQARIETLWNDNVVPFRAAMWDRIELELKQKVARDIRSALDGGSRAFELIRYGYEGGLPEVRFSISDLPGVLGQVILEKKPEWAGVRRSYQELPPLGV